MFSPIAIMLYIKTSESVVNDQKAANIKRVYWGWRRTCITGAGLQAAKIPSQSSQMAGMHISKNDSENLPHISNGLNSHLKKFPNVIVYHKSNPLHWQIVFLVLVLCHCKKDSNAKDTHRTRSLAEFKGLDIGTDLRQDLMRCMLEMQDSFLVPEKLILSKYAKYKWSLPKENQQPTIFRLQQLDVGVSNVHFHWNFDLRVKLLLSANLIGIVRCWWWWSRLIVMVWINVCISLKIVYWWICLILLFPLLTEI